MNSFRQLGKRVKIIYIRTTFRCLTGYFILSYISLWLLQPSIIMIRTFQMHFRKPIYNIGNLNIAHILKFPFLNQYRVVKSILYHMIQQWTMFSVLIWYIKFLKYILWISNPYIIILAWVLVSIYVIGFSSNGSARNCIINSSRFVFHNFVATK